MNSGFLCDRPPIQGLSEARRDRRSNGIFSYRSAAGASLRGRRRSSYLKKEMIIPSSNQNFPLFVGNHRCLKRLDIPCPPLPLLRCAIVLLLPFTGYRIWGGPSGRDEIPVSVQVF